jgi:hypothetical protein
MGQLLLRSNRDKVHETRVEVFFQNVRHIDLPTSFDGLRIELVGDRLYGLSGIGWRGTVDAGVMKVAEDRGSYSDPSSLLLGRLS